ncbi:MAG TPA: THUMP domain-containing protein [Pseudomonadota bacterium]|nr:THUMP domain-containing protein [Pseudomonadota bacterium]
MTFPNPYRPYRDSRPAPTRREEYVPEPRPLARSRASETPRMQINRQHLQLRALCPRGVEPQLAAELSRLPEIEDVLPAGPEGGVRFSGSRSAMYRANLELRCASRVLLQLADVSCRGPEDVYAAAFALPWEEFLSVDGTLAVSAHGTLPECGLSNSMFVALRVKDAICDRFRSRAGRRPDVSVQSPDLRIHVQLYNRPESSGAAGGAAGGRGGRSVPRMVLSLDSSDTPLHERGYRIASVEAPLKETLAATFVEIALGSLHGSATPAGSPASQPTVVDLCCGSGTLLVEAGLHILRRSPGLLRIGGKPRHLGCMGWRDFDTAGFGRVRDELIAQAVRGSGVFLYGYDLDRNAVAAARRNLGTAGLSPFSQISLADLREVAPPPLPPAPADVSAPRIVLCNPPYGERMGSSEDLVGLYRALGDTLKRRFTGYTAYVYTANLDLAKQIGLRPSARHILWNGPLEGRLLQFKLY